MDYLSLFKEKNIEGSAIYSRDDIGVARLFYDLHSGVVRYVVEAKTWYVYNGQRWLKDDGGLRVMELCKSFVQAFDEYARNIGGKDEDFIKYAAKLKSRRKREGILSDAKSIEPMSLSAFDKNKYLFNCINGTLDLECFGLRPHSSEDYITKIARVRYDHEAECPRWEKFVDEVMCGDTETAVFLQKALGYALTGDVSN
ncbi:MAG: nucleoside triphosphatase, partial [Defluviitaleaceae bacterium]|nr:nucleoside triphosphatase [Defluviitaleaceae bacterium]